MKNLMIAVALMLGASTTMAVEVNNTVPVKQCCKKQACAKETFKVKGNCGMCKAKIEKAAKGVDGVIDAQWNKDTKEITVNYDSSKVKMEKVHKAIAAAGYDTEKVKADDAVYDKLHSCCKYDRK
ncbi:MAG: heavy-metal-associated domain-containing protein [Marinifilaceae bacterium]